ncbi:MAG: hypothetical protein AAGA30_05070 [Planctomycetota bacterium]
MQHFRARKTSWARIIDVSTLFVLDFGPWFCSQCDSRARWLPWIRKKHPTIRRVDDGSEQIGNFIRTDSSLVLRKKRSSRFSKKFRQGVVFRLLTGKTCISQLTTELNVTEADLMAWVNELLETKDQRISELTGLLKSYHRAAADLIGITDESPVFDEDENTIDISAESKRYD